MNVAILNIKRNAGLLAHHSTRCAACRNCEACGIAGLFRRAIVWLLDYRA